MRVNFDDWNNHSKLFDEKHSHYVVVVFREFCSAPLSLCGTLCFFNNKKDV